MIAGLSGAGKSMLFNANLGAGAANYPSNTTDSNYEKVGSGWSTSFLHHEKALSLWGALCPFKLFATERYLMRHLIYTIVVLVVAAAPARGQYSNPEILTSIESLNVIVATEAEGEARSCLPFERTLKARIELALQQASLVVTDNVSDTPFALLFNTIAIYPELCAVSYELEILLYYRAPEGTGFPILAFEQGGILSRSDYYGSKKAVEETVDDLVLIAINEILKARNNNR